MIGRISGTLVYKGIDHILIDVHGIGYEVFLSDSALKKITVNTKTISVYTELIVREDLLQLVGFVTRHEREWYRLLTQVQGVGAKAALKILGTLQIGLLSRSILSGDVNAIKASPGIGPKIAQRIITELKDKASSLMALGSDPGFNEPAADGMTEPGVKNHEGASNKLNEKKNLSSEEFATTSSQVQSEALSALTNLGYSSYDAASAVTNVLMDRDYSIELQELIKLALKNLSLKV